MEILTVQSAAGLLEVDPKTVYRLIMTNELPAFKVGRQWRMRLSDIEKWIEDGLTVREAPAAYQLRQGAVFEGRREPLEQKQAGKTGFSDSAFSENNGLAVHRWVSWIAGFSAKFVSEVLARHLPRNGARAKVLDPFAGVGTTLVTAMLEGHDVCGFELNPYAAEACELKLGLQQIPLSELQRCVEEFRTTVAAAVANGTVPKANPPAGFVTRSLFLAPRVQRKVLLVVDYLTTLQDVWVRKCFQIALASELVGLSNYSYEPSLGRRVACGKRELTDAPVVDAVSRKLSQMVEDIRTAQEQLAAFKTPPAAEFHTGDFFELNKLVDAGSVDLVVTSPPYLNNYHYVRNSRPQVYWLGLARTPSDLKEVEEKSFGTYWQTVRCSDEIRLNFEMPDIENLIAALRARNAEKGPYGGPGWANYAATYFNDSRRLAEALQRLLKPGGWAVVVLGNSILQGIEFKTDEFFGAICRAAGLRLEEIHPLRKKRTGASIINSSVRVGEVFGKTTLYESAVIVSKAP